MQQRIDHDRLFKELLESFFADFVKIFFPEAYTAMDWGNIKFLQQEIFTDVTRGDKHLVDILVETKLKGEPGIVLVHVENQAQKQPNFAERMFIYFSRLFQVYRCRVLPIAVFSYPEVKREADRLEVGFPFFNVLDFHFLKLELKKHNWRDYICSNNPVAAALLSKMKYQKKERVQVKLEFLRMLVQMELDPARMTLLTRFFETYLCLDKSEERKLEEEVGKMDKKEAGKVIELTTSWEEKGRIAGRAEGRAEGRIEGKAEGKIEGQPEMLLKQLKKKFGDVPADIENQIRSLPGGRLEQLAESIFDLRLINI